MTIADSQYVGVPPGPPVLTRKDNAKNIGNFCASEARKNRATVALTAKQSLSTRIATHGNHYLLTNKMTCTESLEFQWIEANSLTSFHLGLAHNQQAHSLHHHHRQQALYIANATKTAVLVRQRAAPTELVRQDLHMITEFKLKDMAKFYFQGAFIRIAGH